MAQLIKFPSLLPFLDIWHLHGKQGSLASHGAALEVLAHSLVLSAHLSEVFLAQAPSPCLSHLTRPLFSCLAAYNSKQASWLATLDLCVKSATRCWYRAVQAGATPTHTSGAFQDACRLLPLQGAAIVWHL